MASFLKRMESLLEQADNATATLVGAKKKSVKQEEVTFPFISFLGFSISQREGFKC